ncbi:OTU domain-containing protein 7B [Geodia barretti]|uniref:ubiquitinyl hydrolase 1 n=1 Tax=Geodia barretti TaxID=519541 RepID=A0AA35XI96_GEOBA|nr:OTU domain-containing protein 7B [Geodia barretti]
MASTYQSSYAPSTSQHGSTYYTQSHHHQPSTTRLELPRSISTTNLQMTKQCQDYVRNDLCSTFPGGGTCFFMHLPGYTFTIPHLAEYPPDFRQFVFDRIIDQAAKRSLEEENCLNWFPQATKLQPLNTTGDGNCLLHAASLGMWGFQDRDHFLRNAVSQAVQHAAQKTNTFYMRWEHNKNLECQEQGYQLEPYQWQREWETVVRHASPDPTPTATLYSLEEFHVFVLANVLRRPVIMYASQKMRSFNSGGTMQTINFHGVYLPLLWASNCCKKDPLPLSYQGGHFSALVVIDSSQQYRDGKLVLPLVDFNGYSLPVRFTLAGENPQELLNDYLSLVDIPDTQSKRMVPCATVSVNTKPTYYERLVGAFIDACHTVHFAQQPQQQAQHSQSESYSGGSGVVVRDGRYASAVTAPVETSYSTVARQPTQASQGGEQSGKLKCINNCGMYGDPETAGLCTKCHEKTLAAVLQQESPTSQARRQSATDSGATGMSGPTSIKCPNCSQPGHPKYLGMCENCYHGSQQNQPQYGNQPAQPQYGNQTQPQPQYGNETHHKPQYGNQTQPQYGNRFQPLYGNEPGGQPQYGNQGPQDNTYETLDSYQQKPAIPPRQGEQSTPPVPLPRSTASPEERNKCRTSNCEFFGTAVTRFYCSKCFNENMDAIFRETERSGVPMPAPAENHLYDQTYATPYHGQLASSAHTSPYHGQHAAPPPAEEQGKCTLCHDYYGSPEYGGLCHGCHKTTKDTNNSPDRKCLSCHEYYGSEEYGGLCNGCFLRRTEHETRAPAYQQPEKDTFSSADLPPADFSYFDYQQPLSPKPGNQPPQPEHLAASQVPQPYLQPVYKPMTEPQPGGVAHSQASVTSRPVPKPRSRSAVTTTYAPTNTAPVVTASDMTSAMAGMNISSTNRNPPIMSCFMCMGVTPDSSAPSALCPQHAEFVTKLQVGLAPSSQVSTGGHQTQLYQTPLNAGQSPGNRDMVPNSSSQYWAQSHSQSIASSARPQPYETQYNMPRSTSPVPQSSGGAMAHLQPASQYDTETVKSKPPASPQHGVGYLQPYYSSQGAAHFDQPTPSQYPVAGTHNVHQTGSTVGGGGATFNNLSTNTSGSGVLANRHQEEMGAAGVGMQLRQAQGATGSGAGVIMGGGDAIGIQAGLRGAADEATAPAVKVLCKTAGCSFYAKPELENLCTNCYDDYYYDDKKPDN